MSNRLMPCHRPVQAMDFSVPGTAGIYRSGAPFLRVLTASESGRKWGEKSGDFYAPSPLKNVAKSTY
jgi:hypothetical protein